ncbi:glycosyltransferase family 2 protein [Cylindrospermum sp. FACHB-282]|uniref:glycosyltransferase family 2 protein n=1 Tax=Cylindrospermum sp. FACHB-282 TaxID=2692794 RepID=UPI0016882FEC|nr:glycosyltransferase family 2 protein [Cylindrospermum sp. FACHB-282]MBD2385331.1 glycosyltransferase [Cylindrospermum sp. FACHB-282]
MSGQNLSTLPLPLPGKIGWPWTDETQKLPEKMPDGSEWPKITIVTPNYNYGQFIEETIRSVLLQGYPNLEYIIIDGGSTDNSVDIIKKYEPWLTYWVSEKDQGQASAINKGIELATGTWFNWLNSDDILLQNSLITLAEISKLIDNPKWISGMRIEINQSGSFGEICAAWRYDPSVIGLGIVDFPQDATFVNLEFIKKMNIRLSESYQNVFDTVFHFQLMQYEKPLLTTAIFSAMRWHDLQKTANSVNIHSESTAILAYIQKLPLSHRLIHRLLRTRLSRFLTAILLLAIVYDVLPYSRNWSAALFDRMSGNFKLVPARSSLLFR